MRWTQNVVSRQGECQHRRWVVEKTFAWLGNYRRLSKDYEHLTSSSEALIYMASCDIILKQLANTNTPTRRSI